MQKIATWVYLIFFTLLPLLFAVSTSELFELPKFIFLLATSILILLCYLFDGVINHSWQISRLKNPISVSVLAILITQLLATLTSIHPYTSFWGYYSRFHQGLLTTLCYTVLYLGTLKYLTIASFQKLLKSILSVSLVIAVLAILEHFNWSVTCPFIYTASYQGAGQSVVVDRRFFSDSCWKNTTNPLNRSFVTLGQPNWLAAYLIPNIFLLSYLYFTKKQKNPATHSLPYYAGFFALTLALLFTKSRSGYIAFGASSITYFLLMMRHIGKSVTLSFIYKFALVVLVALAVYFVPTWWRGVSSEQVDTGETALTTVSTSSGEIRKIVWAGVLKLFEMRPILGFGPETFAYTYYQVRPVEHNYTTEWELLYNKAHNEYLNFLATSGVIGLAAYLYFHSTVFLASLKKVEESKKINREKELHQKLIRPFLGAAIVSFTVTNFFGFSIIPIYAFITIFSVLPLISSDQDPLTKLSTKPLLGFVALASFLLVVFPGRYLIADLYYTLGKSAGGNKRTDDAINFLETARSLRPYEDLYLTYLGELYSASNQVERAIPLLTQVNSHNNLHINYLRSLTKSYLNLASKDPTFYDQALSTLERSTILAPTDPKLFYNLGLIYAKTGQTDKAVSAIVHAHELKYDYYDPYYALTLLYESTKQEKLIPDLLTAAKANLATIPDPLKLKIDKYLGK